LDRFRNPNNGSFTRGRCLAPTFDAYNKIPRLQRECSQLLGDQESLDELYRIIVKENYLSDVETILFPSLKYADEDEYFASNDKFNKHSRKRGRSSYSSPPSDHIYFNVSQFCFIFNVLLLLTL
jgi:hypothetical protein